MRSLRSRLTLTHTLVALVAVGIVAILVTILIRLAFDRQRQQINTQQFRDAAELAAARLGLFYERRGGWAGVDQLLRRQLTQAPQSSVLRRLHLQLFDAQGHLLLDTATPALRRQAPRIANGIASPVVVDGRTVGTVVVEAPGGALDQNERRFLLGVYLSVVAGSVLAGVIALGVGLLITGRVTRPLRSLKDAAQRLASGARHEPLPIPPDAELAELATAFNTMASELERQQHLRRQLVADIAHELRTPLSILRLQIESLQDGIEQPTPAMLASLAEEAGLLTRLVDDLRLLSLADAGQLSLAIDVLDAGAMIERAVNTAATRARRQGIDLRGERPPAPLFVMADPQRLAQILGNLIENALRYTPPGGQVTVGARAEHTAASTTPAGSHMGDRTSVIFEVTDSGPGIPADELPHVFERFYRADKARTRETGGSGLGLAIVQRLTEMQGGRTWVTSAPGQGATFHVALPDAPTPIAVDARAGHPLPQVTQR